MEVLLEKIQKEYDEFCDKEYIFYLENETYINLKCKKENLPHLIGLHKLESEYNIIRQMVDKNDNTVTPKNIFDLLKENNISYDDFKKCRSWTTHIQDRMENFTYEKINSILRKTTMFTYIYNKKKTKNNKAKYVLLDKKDSLFLHLYIGYDERLRFYYPNSYVPNKIKDSNLSRDTLKIVKTEIYRLSEQGREKIEVIEHFKIREIKLLIKEYNTQNSKFYKAIEKKEDTEKMLVDINKIVNEVIIKYKELESYADEDLNIKLKMFIENKK